MIFRRQTTQIRNEGGLWHESQKLYPLVRAHPRETTLEWDFPSGARGKFAHLEHEKDKLSWQGAQIPFIGFDELTHFTEGQFWYLLSRNRSMCGVRPYVRATCNPDADSWVAKLIEWWIDQETGYPIPERSGVIRWFVRVDEKLIFSDSPEELQEQNPDSLPKSLTFVPAKLDDNAILEAMDPGYRSNLMALPLVERERLLGGNWKIRPAAGLMFPRDKWQFLDVLPAYGTLKFCRSWDKAGTEGGTGARTAGVLIARWEDEPDPEGNKSPPRWIIVHAIADRWNDIQREKTIRTTAEQDKARYGNVRVMVEQEPGSGGKQSAAITVRGLSGFDAGAEPATGEKASRWRPLAAQVQAGNVWILKGDWDWPGYIDELDALAGDKELDEPKLKDLADASAGGFNELALIKRVDLAKWLKAM